VESEGIASFVLYAMLADTPAHGFDRRRPIGEASCGMTPRADHRTPQSLMIIIEHMDWTYRRMRTTIVRHSEGRQKGTPMKHKYDLFEKFPDGSSLWRACVIGQEGARHHMRELAANSANQFYAMHLVTGKIVFSEFHRGGIPGPARVSSARHSTAATA
jgi:hypothetical protein